MRSIAVVVLVLGICCLLVDDLAAVASQFERAAPGRVLSFPKDHGKHPDFQTEWWYFTGNAKSPDGSEWGFQLTFFRRALTEEPVRKKSAWAVRDIYPAHFALTDIKNRGFFHTELISRKGPGLANAATDKLHVFVKNWSAEQRGETIHLKASADGHALDLTLVPEKPIVLHGDSGFSRKGSGEAQASHYYSFTRLGAKGSLTFKDRVQYVTGLAWMDHEFGSSILHKNQAGWDWFSLQLGDGTEIMAFYLRRKDGTMEPPFGTFVKKNGEAVDLHGKTINIRSVATWTSPHTGARYPSGWILEIPELRMSVRIEPAVKDQELHSAKATGIAYWEGAVIVSGSRSGAKVQGKGYAELTGYAQSMGEQL